MQLAAKFNQLKQSNTKYLAGLGTPLLVMAALGMVVLPMPAFLLDILFSLFIKS